MGAAEEFDCIAGEWDEFKREPLEAARLLAESCAEGGRALLVGCGNARNAPLLQGKFDSVEGVDASPRMVELAKANGLQARVADARELPFDDSSLDAAFYFAVLHHLDEAGLRQALSEAARVLKPGGRAYATLWFKKNRRGFHPVKWKKKDGSTVERSYWFYSLAEVRECAESNGFKIMDAFYEARGERSGGPRATNTCFVLEK